VAKFWREEHRFNTDERHKATHRSTFDLSTSTMKMSATPTRALLGLSVAAVVYSFAATCSAFSPISHWRSGAMAPPQFASASSGNGNNICPEIPTTPSTPTNEIAVLASG
jgi:hypothetical protein